MSGERRRVTGPQVEIELDPGLDDTRCVACGRSVALCSCPPHVRDAAMAQAEAEALRRRVRQALAELRRIPGWDGLDRLARVLAAAPRWVLHSGLPRLRRRSGPGESS